MKFGVEGILVVGIFAMSAGTVLAAQTNSWPEEWYRAKYGRPSPSEQTRIDATRKPEAQIAAAEPVTRARRVNGWLEQFYKEKYGRPTPREDARIREANLGKDAVMTSKGAAPADLAFENRYRAKYGRPSPVESR
jgi:hypothetical protein